MRTMSVNLIHDIEDEMYRAVETHGELPRTGDRCMTIMTEEVGEAAQALLEWNREPDLTMRRPRLEDLRAELIQVIAVAVRFIQNIDEGVMI